jgi:hypothetical protein
MGYIAALFASLPVALPLWNAGLGDTVGRVVTIQQIHLAQYLGLGALAAACARTAVRPWAAGLRLAGLMLAVGFLDEMVQRALPQRVFDWADVGLNWAGGLVGLLLGGALGRGLGHARRGRLRRTCP